MIFARGAAQDARPPRACARSQCARMRTHDYDIAIVGAGFAGLACARAAARRGLRVLVIDRKPEPGARMHTTGLVVKEAAERWEIPAALTRRVRGVRLYAPSLAALDLAAPGYYFLATDTPALMRWLAREACRAGAHLRWARRYCGAARTRDGFVLGGHGERVRCLVGADGPHSAVARNSRSAATASSCSAWKANGAASAASIPIACTASSIAGWRRATSGGWSRATAASCRWAWPRGSRIGTDLAAFERKVARLFDFSAARRIARRGGLIPVGGPVSPFAAPGVVLIGDAAGVVSPLSAGGIHTALESGWAAAQAIADHLREGAEAPAHALARSLPRFAHQAPAARGIRCGRARRMVRRDARARARSRRWRNRFTSIIADCARSTPGATLPTRSGTVRHNWC